jgi:hypothetical protein
MGFFDRSKSTDYLQWGEDVSFKRQADPDEPAMDIGESLLGKPRNVKTRDSRFESQPFLPFDGPQGIDGETEDGINVREIYRGHGVKDLLGTQVKGAEVGRI